MQKMLLKENTGIGLYFRFLVSGVFVFLLLSACKVSDIDVQEWKKFTSEKGGFKAEFIAEPKESFKNIRSQNGIVSVYLFTANTNNPRMTFQVAYSKYPLEPIMDEDNLRIKYDSVTEGLVKLRGIKVNSTGDIRLNGKLGRQLIFQEGIYDGKSRLFLVGKRQYQIFVGSEHSFEQNPKIDAAANKFLDSFSLIDVE